ncbi:MAG: alpha-galactosidase [Oscillospiraceae bacterium]|nr:alpha-galactosidase [Oscillospiraceae bacterium]
MKLRNIEFAYTSGGQEFSVTTTGSVRTDAAALEIRSEPGSLQIKLHAYHEIEITRLCAVYEYDFQKTERIFLNGYQSWTDSWERSINSRMHGLERVPKQISDKYAFTQYGDYNFVKYSYLPGRLHGFSYGYIRRGNRFRFFGSLAEDSGFTIIRTDTRRNTVSFEKDCSGLHLRGDFDAMRLLLAEGPEAEVFDRYFDELGVKLRPEAKPIFGYTSWYRHYQNISDRIIAEDLAGLRSQQYQADVFQIDDGYQTAVGDWLSVNADKFPDGMKPVADSIREAGMLPGIWMAPFAAEEHSALCKAHPDWFVKNSDGSPVRGGSNWSGFYALDIYCPQVRDYLREVFRVVTKEWGFGLLKLDFLYAACIVPRRDKTRGQIMADAMKFLREIAGDAFILGCGVPLASAFGRVDYCRIGCDVSLDWNDKPAMRLTHRERVSTRNTILNSTFRRQLNGRAFLNDPDVFLLRSDQTEMSLEQKTCLGEINALTGGVLFTSDNAAQYEEAQCRLLTRLMHLREAQVISAEISGGLLKVRFRWRGKLYVRVYPL